MPSFGFCGGSYTSLSPIANAERTVNFYPEFIEAEKGKTRVALYPTMGSKPFATLNDIPMRQLFRLTTNGIERVFAGGGTYLYEIYVDGSSKRIGAIGADGNPVTMAASQTQLAVTAGGKLFIIGLGDDSFQVARLDALVSQVAATDAYFIALQSQTQRFQISGLVDGLTWNPIDIAQVSIFPDDVLSMLVDHREIMLFSSKAILPYFDSGNPFFPFEPVGNGYIEDGICAAASPQKLDNSFFWLSGSERGTAIAKRAQGYTPTRISNSACESAWQSYVRRDDAIGYSYQLNGHEFYVLRFPTAFAIPGSQQFTSATWAYDISTGLWHEWSWWDSVNGIETAHQSQSHVYAFGRHLVANPVTGNVDEISLSYYDDNGAAIRRSRRTPWVSNEKQRIYFPGLELDCEAGLAPIPPLLDGDGNPRGPQAMLHWSDDGTKSWSNEHWRSLGLAGKYSTRLRWLRLGQSRGRIFELVYSDPVPLRIADAYLIQ